MKKSLMLLILIVLLVVIVEGCARHNQIEDPNTKIEDNNAPASSFKDEVVKIGILIPLSGRNVQVGIEVKALCELFEDAINNTVDINLPFSRVKGLPNLNSAQVEFVYGDLSTAAIAKTEAERLIKEEGVIGITGTLSSEVTKSVAEITEKYGVILLSEGTSISLLDAGYAYYGRTYPNDASFVKETFNYLNHLNTNQNAGIKKIAFVCENSEFGTNIAKILREYAITYNYEIVEDISYSALADNVNSEVLRLKQSDPDVVIMSSYTSDSILLMSTLKAENYFPKMVFGQRGGFTASYFINTLGEDANYCFTTSRWNSDFTSKVSQELIKKYKTEYSDGTDLISDVLAAGWDAYLIAIMTNQAGTTDVEGLRQVMYDGIIVSPEQDPTGLPGYKYGADGQNSVSLAIVLQIFESKFITVYPEKFSVAEGIYPAPPWGER